MIHLDYRDARPIYAQIADGIRAQISAGILEADAKLPSVRELAAELSINPNTIQRSYRTLEAEGWIVTVPGKGCFVVGQPQRDPGQFDAFDRAAGALLAQGITREDLIRRLLEGGK